MSKRDVKMYFEKGIIVKFTKSVLTAGIIHATLFGACSA